MSTMSTITTMTTTTTLPVTDEICIPRMVGTFHYKKGSLEELSYEIGQLENYMIPASEQLTCMYKYAIERIEEKIRDHPEDVTKNDNERLKSSRDAMNHNFATLEKLQEGLRKRREMFL